MDTAAPTMKIMNPRRTTGLEVMKVRILAIEVVNHSRTSVAVVRILDIVEGVAVATIIGI